jgi:hypothetical protein
VSVFDCAERPFQSYEHSRSGRLCASSKLGRDRSTGHFPSLQYFALAYYSYRPGSLRDSSEAEKHFIVEMLFNADI